MVREKYCSSCGKITLFLNNNCLSCESGFDHVDDFCDDRIEELSFQNDYEDSDNYISKTV